MKKTLILSTALISIFTLSGCSDTTKKQVQSENSQDSSTTKPSKSSEESRSSSTSESTVSSTDAPDRKSVV